MSSNKMVCAAFAIATVLGFGTPVAADDAPKGNVGYTTTKNISIDLGPEIPAMAGWQLRLRVLNIAPGGHIGIHNHKDRPATVYFLQGTDTVTNEDGSAKTFKAGDVTAEGVKTVHWHRNVGTDAVIIVTTDLVKTAK